MAYGIALDGTITKLPTGYEALRKFVGGYIGSARTRNGTTHIWVHDEGLRLGLPLNETATLLAGQPLVGPAVLVTPHEDDVDREAAPRTHCPICKGAVRDEGWCGVCDRSTIEIINGATVRTVIDGARRRAATARLN